MGDSRFSSFEPILGPSNAGHHVVRRLFLPNRAPGMLVTENGRLVRVEGREGGWRPSSSSPTKSEIITTNHTVKSDKKAASVTVHYAPRLLILSTNEGLVSTSNARRPEPKPIRHPATLKMLPFYLKSSPSRRCLQLRDANITKILDFYHNSSSSFKWINPRLTMSNESKSQLLGSWEYEFAHPYSNSFSSVSE